MSRFLVLTRPGLVNGFLLAGVEAQGVQTSREAEAQISRWLQADLHALLAVDEAIFDELKPQTRRRLSQSASLFVVTIPATVFQPSHERWQQQIAERIRQAIGVHITFKD